MGHIIHPGRELPAGQKVRVSWDVDKIHPTLLEDLKCNLKVFPRYLKGVVEAVQATLSHPDTKPLFLTEQIVQERIALAHKLLLVMRQDGLFALRRCIDHLESRMIEVLRRDAKTEDVVEEVAGRSTWTRGKETEATAHAVGEHRDPQEDSDAEDNS